MSDTPRTDAARRPAGRCSKPHFVVPVAIAAGLERELSAATARRARLESALSIILASAGNAEFVYSMARDVLNEAKPA